MAGVQSLTVATTVVSRSCTRNRCHGSFCLVKMAVAIGTRCLWGPSLRYNTLLLQYCHNGVIAIIYCMPYSNPQCLNTLPQHCNKGSGHCKLPKNRWLGSHLQKWRSLHFKQRLLILWLMLVYVCRQIAGRGMVKKTKNYEQELAIFSNMWWEWRRQNGQVVCGGAISRNGGPSILYNAWWSRCFCLFMFVGYWRWVEWRQSAKGMSKNGIGCLLRHVVGVGKIEREWCFEQLSQRIASPPF